MLRAHAENFASDMMQRLADEVGPQRFKIWFKGATSFALTDGIVNVGVPNQFVGGWIERHFADTIRKTAADVAGGPMEVAFSIDPSLARQLRKKQPDSQMEYASNNPERVAREMKRSGTQPPVTLCKYTFDDFVVGVSNRLAYSTALSVAEQPAAQFSPLFIHGACGLGKTHLVQAICHKIQTDRPELTSRYLSGEDFTNHFVFSTKSGEVDKFRNHYRNVDVLVIDDVHFFSNKRGTQQEFLHTFNAIDAAGRQVVMASDAHPKMISHLSENLVSRFVSGMVVKIDPPDYQTRVEVLQRRAAKMGRDIPAPVLEYIAELCDANIRELEGALLKLLMFAQVNQKPITRSLAVQGLRDLIQRTAKVVRLSDIETVVAIYFGLTQADLHTSRKSRTIALARSIAMHLARTHTDMSFPEIGRFMGNKNHSTVLLACRRIGRQLEADSRVRWLTGRGEQERRVREVLSELEEQLGRPTAAA
ncbi:MAG: chromosomal replication initiator protein DnaA [Phycisphaerales bacterium]|nr:chromosomal replication initiator protein DnaA [Phycisphaerales bacterium]